MMTLTCRNHILSLGKMRRYMYLGGGHNTVEYWQPRCMCQLATFVLFVQAYVPWSCDAYRLPNPFSCFTFTYPSTLHHVSCAAQCAHHNVLFKSMFCITYRLFVQSDVWGCWLDHALYRVITCWIITNSLRLNPVLFIARCIVKKKWHYC